MESKLVWGLGLLAASILLMIVEIFVPSAGAIAFVAVTVGIAGIVTLWIHDPWWGFISLLVMLVLAPTIFFYGLSIWRHTPIGRRVIGEPSEEETEKQRIAEEKARDERLKLLGSEGVAATDLRPVGVVMINGQRHDALSESVLIPAGSKVKVTVVELNQLKVRAIG